MELNNIQNDSFELIKYLIDQVRKQQDLINGYKFKLTNIDQILKSEVIHVREGKIETHE